MLLMCQMSHYQALDEPQAMCSGPCVIITGDTFTIHPLMPGLAPGHWSLQVRSPLLIHHYQRVQLFSLGRVYVYEVEPLT